MSELSSEFKAKVAIAVVQSRGDIEQVSITFDVPSTLVHEWHEELLERASELFKAASKSDN